MIKQLPEKPKTTKEQVSVLWDIVANHLITQVRMNNMKLNFVLGFLGLIMGLIGITIALVIK